MNVRMNIKGVLISLNVKGSPNTFEASGTLLDSNRVLLTGTVLLPLVEIERQWVASFLKSISSTPTVDKGVFDVSFRVFQEIVGNNQGTEKKFLSLESKVVGVWKCPLVSRSVEKLFCDWTVGHVNHYKETRVLSSDEIDLSKELMSVFMLLKCKGELEQCSRGKSDDDIRVLLNLLPSLDEPKRGEEVEVLSTPFGNEHFYNSLSRGIVSNVIGRGKCIFLFDARTVSGCEGGPIFAVKRSRNEEKEKGNLIGLVTCPLTWWRGEWIGLTIGISLMPVLKRLLETQAGAINFIETSNNKSSNSLSDLLSLQIVDETVVLIRSGTFWGSGVVLDADSGTIITCSHVVRNEKTVSVFYKGNYQTSTVVFRSRDDLAYDLAVIVSLGKSIYDREAEFYDKSVKIGDSVIAAGFPLFSERDDLHIRPAVVSGCISTVNPYMIQTTCCIQSGISGGALFRDGKLLGIVVSNARNSSAAFFPHINFVIPASVFREPVMRYLKTRDVRDLEELESSDRRVQYLWGLQTSKL